MSQAVISSSRPNRVPPGPKGHWLWGSMLDFQADPLRTYAEAARQYGDIVRFRFGPWHSYLVTHPDYVRHVLQDNHRNYNKGRITHTYLKPLLGEGLLTSEGEFWLRQRRLIQPAFHKQRLAHFGQAMTDKTLAMLQRWQAYADSGEPFDVSAEMMRLTLSIVGQTLFSAEVEDTSAEVGEAMEVAQAHVNYRSTHPFSLPERFPTPRNRRFHQARATFDRVLLDIIEERRRSGEDKGDLLGMLLAARDEATGEGMSNQQLRDEAVTLFLAGHETTSNTLTWTWYLLAEHPAVARRLREELAAVLGGRTPTVADVPHLKYTVQVIEEAMRLYPAAWVVARGAIGADEIGGYPIPAGSMISISPFITHRHPDFWPVPEAFDPDRFTPERSAGRPRYAYFPFGGGPRQCIGNNFAMLEATLLLATIAQAGRLDLVPGHPVVPEPLVTLRPRHGMRMRFVKTG